MNQPSVATSKIEITTNKNKTLPELVLQTKENSWVRHLNVF